MKTLLLFLLLIYSLESIGQADGENAAHIVGKLQGQRSEVLESAEVTLVSGSQVIAASLSDKEGNFALDAAPGRYRLAVNFMGFELYHRELEIDKDADLGLITVSIARDLEEVVVEKKKQLVERKADRLVFNLENTTAAAGGDALDALKLVPRLKVENDAVSIIGRGGVMIMVDDRMLRLTGDELSAFLKSLRAEDIKSIEVIANPPAKYSAEGNSGLINIRLKKVKQDTWNGYVQGTYKQNTYAYGLGNTGFSYSKDKLSVQAAIGNSEGSNGPTGKQWFLYPEYLWKENSRNRSRYKLSNARLGADYKLSDRFTAGMQYNGNRNNYRTSDVMDAEIINSSTHSKDSLIKTRGEDTARNTYHSLNYHFTYSMDTIGKKLSFDADYFTYTNRNNRVFETDTYDAGGNLLPDSFTSLNNIGGRTVDNFSANADMEHPLKSIRLNYGVRFSYTKTSSDIGLYDLSGGMPIWDASQGNKFVFKENTRAAFIEGAKEFGRWEAKAGLRVESTRTNGKSLTTGEENTIDYAKLFPTAYVIYKPNEGHSISLNYGRRIQRPNFEFLNPFRMVDSQYSYSEGNPYLQPSFANALELEYGYKDYYNVSAYYSSIKGDFEKLVIIDPETGIQANRPLNFINNKTFGISQNVISEFFPWYKMNFNADIFYCDSRSTIPVTLQFLKGWNGEFMINNDFTLNKNKTFLLNINYRHITSGTANLDASTAFSQLNATLKLFLLNKKLQFSLNGNDIFAGNRTTYTGVSNNVKTSYRNYGDLRMLRFTIRYSFGGDAKNSEQQNKNSEEQNRL